MKFPRILLSLVLLSATSLSAASRPNVVTLLVDDLGYRDLGCYGGPVKTPVLDKLAAEGVRFTDFHSGAPVCSPSRATFLTGRNHIRAGVWSVLSEQRHRMHLLRSETTLAEVLKDEGYGTAHFGKWHLGMPVNNRDNPTPAEHGFHYWFGLVNGAHPSHKDPTNFLRNGKPVGPMKGYSCQLVVDEAITWLDEKRDADAPFFINLWFNEPHAVIAAPDEIVSRYGALNDQAVIYNGTIDNTDRAIGRLVAKLEQLGELDNTIIHYSSDNGSYRQERSGELRGKKGSHHEGGHRVPGIFYWKGKIPGGRVEKEPAGAVDLLPTICGLLGIDKPKDVFLDGSDLTHLLTRTGSFERHQPLFWMNGSTMVLRMGDHTLLAPSTSRLPFDNAKANRLLQQTRLALGDDLEKELGGLDLRSRMFNGRFANREANRLRDEFRAMFYFNEALIPLMKKGGVDRVQLYDLARDLSQTTDIASQNPNIVARMKKQANAIYRSVMADAPEWLTPEELAAAKKPGASDTDTAKLLARIDKNPLPKGYHGSRHQAYVDRVMADLKREQRARVGQLWKEKRRLDPNMPNRGASFVRILTHVAAGAGEADPAGRPSGAKTRIRSGSRQKVRPSHEPKVSAASTANTSRKRPNVVVLFADDLGSKDIGCYGGPVKTPALDELAAKGVRFTDFYAGAAVCGPSRAVLLTGRHHARAGIYGNVIFDSIQKPHLLRREVTLPEVLKKHGYGTAHFGKWHLGMPTRDVKKPTPAEHGFDYWFGMNSGAHPSHKDPVNFLRNSKPVGKIEGYSCQIVVDEAISWLDNKRDPEAPFFLNLWFHEPHDRVAAPESIVSQYGKLTDQAAVYSATIDNTDRAIARLLEKLKEVDSLENTLILYTSDNGSYRADRNGNLRGRKGSNFEGGIRVPGIWYWPGTIKSGHVEHEPAGVVDLLPTVCGLLGIDKPEGVHLDGSDISPLLTGRDNEFARHQPLYWHLPSNNPSLAIRDGNYSMVAYRDYEFPRDRQAIKKVEKEIEEVLRKANSPELVPWVKRTDFFYKKFRNKDAERLRGKFMRLNVFQDSWIPVLKSGNYHRFQLFDLAADPTQKVDVSKQFPEVFSRLKRQLLKINASVMAEAPDWGSAEKAPTHSSPKPATSKKPKRPNVVVLLADDLGSKDLGCYGGPVKTPVLDGLAAKGVRFTDFHAGAAVCSPSRATLLTGRQNLRTGIYGVLQDHWHNMHLLEREVTIAEVLQKAGYGTAHFGKWHIGMTSGKRKKPSLQDHGFDYWFGLSNGAQPSHRNPTNFMRNGKRVGPMKGYSCQIVVSDAINWLETKANPDQPFFMNIWFNEPHSKLAAPDEITSIYGDLKDEAAIYSATVDNTDRAIGRLVAKLKETGKLDNTLIIYSSDHGSYRADRNGGLTGSKGSNFQGGLRSPGIFFWPDGVRGGRIESTPSGAVDLLPTICGLAGIDKPKGVHLDGSDLSSLLTEKGKFKRSQPMFWLAPSSGHLATLREGNYTLMGYRGYKLPANQARKNELLRQMASLAGIDPSTPNLGSRVTNTTFTSPEYNRLKNEFVRLRTFQEAWIPAIKAGGFSRFALYDLKADPLQKKDISKQRPEVTNRLKKKLLTLYKDVMADAPDWPSK